LPGGAAALELGRGRGRGFGEALLQLGFPALARGGDGGIDLLARGAGGPAALLR